MPSLKKQSPKLIVAAAALAALWMVPRASAQDRDRDFDHDGDRGRFTRLEPGMAIPVRTDQTIDVDRSDHQVYWGRVDQDVFGENGRLAIPRGSSVEMTVRVAPDNDLILDMQSVRVNGERYALEAHPDRIESQRDNSVVGTIIGALGGQVRGEAVRVPRDSVVTFRLEQPLVMQVPRTSESGYRDQYPDTQSDYQR